jgi:hypothetical protein
MEISLEYMWTELAHDPVQWGALVIEVLKLLNNF